MLNLSTTSETKNLTLVRDFVTTAAKDVGFDDIAINNIIIAVDEACTNVIKHAYKYSPNNPIDVSITLDNKKFNIIIKDKGTSFDPSAIPPPDMKEYFKQYKVGGLGIHLMKNLMDEVVYNSKPNEYNEVILSKQLPPDGRINSTTL
jgi:serine/threonine-protein kinase RsbW